MAYSASNVDILSRHGAWKERSDTRGFTFVELLIVVSIIGLLLTIALPSFASARNQSRKDICIHNLMALDVAKLQWALEERRSGGNQPTEGDLDRYFRRGVLPQCPGGGTYTFGKVKDPTECSLKDEGHVIHDDPTP